jgi:hypothetical protein
MVDGKASGSGIALDLRTAFELAFVFSLAGAPIAVLESTIMAVSRRL